MALINRITRLFRADLHAVLDRIEEPDVLLRQSVREMSADISDDERRLYLLEQDKDQHGRREQEISERLDRLTQELDVCFAADQDDLARSLIRRRLEAENMLSALKSHTATTNIRISELQQRLQENRTRLAAIEQKREIFAATEATVAGDSSSLGNCTGVAFNLRHIGDEEVEIALLAEKQQRVVS